MSSIIPIGLLPANDLSDLNSIPDALQNIGLGFYANGNLGATPTIDWTRGATQTGTLNADCTLTFSSPHKPGRFQLILAEDGTGNHTITKPGDATWEQGAAPLPIAAGLSRLFDVSNDGSGYRIWYSPANGDGLLTVVTAATNTQLTASSPQIVLFTGSTTHGIYMPDVTTLPNGWAVRFINTSTGGVTLRSSGANLILVVPAGASITLIFNGTASATASAWTIPLVSLTSGVTGILSTLRGGTGEDNSTGGTANTFFARPDGASGAASFRAIAVNDVPSLSGIYLTLAAAVAGFQPLDADLTALAGLDTTAGLLAKTAANTYARRSIAGTANEITVTNGDGQAANPTVSLPSAMTLTGKTMTGGTYVGAVSYNGAYFGTINTITPSTTPTVDFSLNQNQSLALSGDTTFTFTGPAIAGYVTLKITDSVGGRTRTWPGNVTWISGRAPRTLSGSSDPQIVFGWFDGATYWMDYTPSAKDRITGTGTTAPADADMANSTWEEWVDDTADNPAVGIKFSDSAGTKKSAYLRTNKPRVVSTTSSATPSINTDVTDILRITALAENITSMTTNMTGTPAHGQRLRVEITPTATRTITWGASFGSGLPTAADGTALLAVELFWNSATSLWEDARQDNPRIQTLATNSPTPDLYYDEVDMAVTGSVTLNSPTNVKHGKKFILRFKDDGTGRSITPNAIYRAIGVALSTTTIANKLTYWGCVYNATDTKVDVVAVAQEV